MIPEKRGRLLFYLALAVVAGFICTPDFPPMVDMPQHAAQAIGLKEIWTGHYRWGSLTELNYFTPYWIGYGLLALLAFAFPIIIATKVLLVAIFLAFVLGFSFLRKEQGAPALLDWFLIPAFFGFAYAWGFMTFLAALAFIGPWFYYANIRWAKAETRKQCWIWLGIIGAIGLVLILSHIMAFCFFALASAIYLVASGKIKKNKESLALMSIYLGFALLFFAFSRQANPLAPYYAYYHAPMAWNGFWPSIKSLPDCVFFGSIGEKNSPAVFFAILIALPFLLGCRFSKKPSAYAMMAAFLLIWLSFPHYAKLTFFIQERFALFFIPAWILCLEKPSTAKCLKSAPWVLAASIAAMMQVPLSNRYSFRIESRQFHDLLGKLPEGEKALSLVFSTNSPYSTTPNVLVQFSSWYQALRGGWVDFNFAWFPPQIIRYRLDKVPEIRPGYEWSPAQELGTLKHCNRYGLVIVHALMDADFLPSLAGTPCASHSFYQREGNWYAFRLAPSLPPVKKEMGKE
jgi:hypothetical protein